MADQERMQRQRSREAARAPAARAREYRQSIRDERQAMGAAALGVGGAGIAAALSAFTGAMEASFSRLQTISAAVGARAGVQDIGQRTASAQDFELALARSSGEFFQGQDPAQMAESMHALQEEVLGVAAASSQSPTALLGVLATMQTEFSQFAEGRANLEAIANEATRTGAEMEGLARFVGVVNHQLGATAPTAERLFDIMAEQGLQGALTPEQLAGDFGGMFGQFTQMSGLEGEDAVRQFGAMANALKTKDMSSAETATLMQNLFTALGNSPTRDAFLEATGGHAVGTGAARHIEGGSTALRSDGTIDFSQFVQDASQVEGIGTSDVVFHDTQARQAAGQLVALARRDQAGEAGVVTMDELAAADAEHGAALRSGNLATVMGTSAIESRRIGVAGEIEGIHAMGGRVDEANDMQRFDEAVRRSGASTGLLGAANAVLPDWLARSVLGGASDQASRLPPQMRQALAYTTESNQSGNGGLTGLLAGAGGSILQSLIGLGDARRDVSGETRARPTKMADGTRVELGGATVAAIAAAVRAPTAPTDGRTPSETGR